MLHYSVAPMIHHEFNVQTSPQHASVSHTATIPAEALVDIFSLAPYPNHPKCVTLTSFKHYGLTLKKQPVAIETSILAPQGLVQ